MSRTKGPKSFSLVILAGGLGRRMGADKSELVYQGKSFLEIQIEKGKKLGIEDILVSGYRGKNCGQRVIMDRFLQRGPLGGMEAALREAANPRCLVLSVDSPLVSVEELRNLMDAADKTDKSAVILQHGEREEPLIGVYRTSLAEEMAEELRIRKGSVFGFLKRIGYEVFVSRGEEKQFQNINDRKSYEELNTEI